MQAFADRLCREGAYDVRIDSEHRIVSWRVQYCRLDDRQVYGWLWRKWFRR
jgi:hypothetical protein